jgi:hypothetical protein
MLFRGEKLFALRSIRNTQLRSVGKIQLFNIEARGIYNYHSALKGY